MGASDAAGSIVVRRQLGRQLRALRDAASITTREVANANLGSETKVWRVETGRISVDVPTIRAWCDLYGASKEQADALADMALAAAGRGWWRDYKDVIPDWFELNLGLETQASRICAWDATLIPGLLQTARYAREVLAASIVADSAATVDRLVGVRLSRQRRILDRATPPELRAVIGEGALCQQVGGTAGMAEQLAHLREVAKRPSVDVRVLPFAAGAHPAMTSAFRLLDFEAAEDPDVAYVEALAHGSYVEKPEEVSKYRTAWETIVQQSVPIGDYQ